MNVRIKIRLLGIFKRAYGTGEVSLETEEGESLREVVQKLTEFSPKLGSVLIDSELGDPRPNAVILVNGREVSVLNGLETKVNDRDEIVFIPVTHGG